MANRDQWKRYIAERGIKPFTQRPEYCQCMPCTERRRAEEQQAAQAAAINAVNNWRTA